MKHIKMYFKLGNGREVIKRHYEASEDYLRGVAENYCKMYKAQGREVTGVYIEFQNEDGTSDAKWIA